MILDFKVSTKEIILQNDTSWMSCFKFPFNKFLVN